MGELCLQKKSRSRMPWKPTDTTLSNETFLLVRIFSLSLFLSVCASYRLFLKIHSLLHTLFRFCFVKPLSRQFNLIQMTVALSMSILFLGFVCQKQQSFYEVSSGKNQVELFTDRNRCSITTLSFISNTFFYVV